MNLSCDNTLVPVKRPRLSYQTTAVCIKGTPRNPFESIKYESFLRIFQKVDSVTQTRLRRVCRKWNKILRSLQVRQVVTLDFAFLAKKCMARHHHADGTLLFSAVAFDRVYREELDEADTHECDLTFSLANAVVKQTAIVTITNSACAKLVSLPYGQYTVFNKAPRMEKICTSFWTRLNETLVTAAVLILENVAIRYHDLVNLLPGGMVWRLILRNVKICAVSSLTESSLVKGFSVLIARAVLPVPSAVLFTKALWELIDQNVPQLTNNQLEDLVRIRKENIDGGLLFADIYRTREPSAARRTLDWRQWDFRELDKAIAFEVWHAYQPAVYRTMEEYFDRYDHYAERHQDFDFGDYGQREQTPAPKK